MVYPLKLMVPLLVRLLMVQSPVRFQVLPASIVRTALSETAVPFCALSTMLMVPIKVLFPFRVMVRVEIVSTTIVTVKVLLVCGKYHLCAVCTCSSPAMRSRVAFYLLLFLFLFLCDMLILIRED